MAALDNMKDWVQALVIVVILVAALALALNDFRDDMGNQCQGSGDTYNSTDAKCYNSSGDVQANTFSYQYNITQEGLTGTANASDYFSTIGTLIGVAAIISVVMIAFYLVQR